ncbi:2-oxo acid dehydrogenase subunit E2 [Lentzea sp. NPDC004789]
MKPAPVPHHRRQTLHFLDHIRGFSPVFLGTDVDMTAVLAHRAAAEADGLRYSVVTYVLHAAAGVLAAHPEANSAIHGRWRPRIARYEQVNAKLALDKLVAGRRAVLSAVLPDLAHAKLADIQRQVEHFRDGDPDTMPEFAGVRRLQRLPIALGRLAFRRFVGPLRRRADLFGTFAVSSLGHRPVDSFHSVGGTTVTFGVGQIAPKPVVRDGDIVVAPVMRLNTSFDHRVIDGGEAADVLAELKHALEHFEVTT